MNLKQFFTKDDDTDRGVSPVIGVILMVAITVILAAVIGAFVLGLGDQVSNNAPQATFDFEFVDNTNANITHSGGDDIEKANLEVIIGETVAYNGTSNDESDPWTDSNTISTGDELKILGANGEGPDDGPFAGETVRIIWNNPSGGASNTIGERDWPN